jgi:hypothetical protein
MQKKFTSLTVTCFFCCIQFCNVHQARDLLLVCALTFSLNFFRGGKNK